MNEIAGSAASNDSIAPSPSTNRNALSEAWYRALYGAQRNPATGERAAHALRARTTPSTPMGLSQTAQPLAPAKTDAGVASSARRQLNALGVVGSRIMRPNASPLVAAPQRATAWRAAVARRTACRLTLCAGSHVDLLVQQRGRRVHVIAVAVSAPDAAHIGDALERTRAALAAHGLRLEIDVRRKGLA